MSGTEIDVGTVLGDTYEVTQLIGQGGMGAVWAVKHRRLPKRFAVKVLLGALQDSEGYARFRREAEIASRIGHPGIVEVLDFNTLPSGTPYLIMEFLEGESLARRLKRGPIPVAETLSLARQIGSALNAAHKNDVVHRDLKPDNIFLVPTDTGGVLSDRVKVLDFGISKIRNAQTVLTQESTLMGTPQYMSPEQASGKNSLVDQRTDVFALGAIVYEMLTGKAAFSGETLATVVVKVMLEPPPPIEELQPSIPKAVRDAVYRALEKEPGKRFPDVAAFIGALTGSPLQTLDRRPVAQPAADDAFASTAAPGTPIPATNPPDAFASTAAGTPVHPATLGSLARGEVAVTNPVDRKKSPLLWVGAAAAGALAIAVAIMAAQPGPGAGGKTTVEPPVPVLDKQPKPATENVMAAVQPKQPPEAVAVAAAPAAVEPKAVEPKADSEKPIAAKPADTVAARPAKPGKSETLPPEVLAELKEAEAALSSGDAREAVRLARHSLLTKSSGRAFSVITRAMCKQGDLGGAKASLHSVDKSELARVKRECKAAGLDL
jgi:eukaryotic-like serine/threonine-protein kinase